MPPISTLPGKVDTAGRLAITRPSCFRSSVSTVLDFNNNFYMDCMPTAG